MTRRCALAVGLLVLIQGALAWGVFVAAPHPGGDNAGYVALAHALSSGQGYTEVWDPARPPHTKYPPVYPLLLAVALALGATGWMGLKAVTLLAALAVPPGVFLWARTRVPDGVAFGVALLTALSPSLLYHSHWVLSDVPFLAFVVWALWAFSGLVPRPGEGGPGDDGDGGGSPGDEGPAPGRAGSPAGPRRIRWVVATMLVVLAAFTRSAGLPLAAAAVGVLALSRRWRAAGGVAVAVGVPFVLWWLRGRRALVAEGRYTREFFLLDPYQPDLGTASLADFGARLGENLAGYLTRFLPEALVGSSGGGVALGMLLVVLLAGVGWVRRVGTGRPGVADLFLPLYLAVILLWPAVWSGDRFALPLVPLLLLLAGEELWRLGRRWSPRARSGALVALGLLVGLPSAADWVGARGEAARCRTVSEAVGPWGCGGPGLLDFAAAAEWAGDGLPAGSVVLTRKPRIWYLNSGLPTRTYPFSEAPGSLRRGAEEAGARYVVLDFIGGQGTRFVGGALVAEPQAFCEVVAVGGAGGAPPTRILELRPPGEDSGTRVSESGVRLARCAGAPENPAPTAAGWGIPLLRR